MNNRIWVTLAGIGVAWGTAGCGGSEISGAGGTGGAISSGHAGTGGSSSAGTGGELPLPSQGSITLVVQPPASPANGQACPDIGTTYEAGLPAPTASNPGGSLVDGEHDTRVACAVRGTGPFTFSGSLQATTTASPEAPIRIELSDGSIGEGSTGTASVSIYTPKLGGSFSSTSCVIQVLANQIKPGAIWASFRCPSLSQAPSGLCSASGVFVFENCLGS